MPKIYDPNLVRVKTGNKHINHITDKSIIKDGMTVQIDKQYYVKIGRKLCRIDITNSLDFNNVKQDNIQAVFKPNGDTIFEVVNDN